jgi:hypothetical protein
MLPKAKIKTAWNNNLAYVVGVITADGNLSPDLRHIVITSKDQEMIINCKSCLGIDSTIGKKARGGSNEKSYFVLQFSDVNFYRFLLNIGLTPRKSLTIGAIKIPEQYYSDFLRGYLDGDGNISITQHPESSKQQVKVRFCSGSKKFLTWLHEKNTHSFNLNGGNICASKISSTHTLSYGKSDSTLLLAKIYYQGAVCLSRKKVLANFVLGK